MKKWFFHGDRQLRLPAILQHTYVTLGRTLVINLENNSVFPGWKKARTIFGYFIQMLAVVVREMKKTSGDRMPR